MDCVAEELPVSHTILTVFNFTYQLNFFLIVVTGCMKFMLQCNATKYHFFLFEESKKQFR